MVRHSIPAVLEAVAVGDLFIPFRGGQRQNIVRRVRGDAAIPDSRHGRIIGGKSPSALQSRQTNTCQPFLELDGLHRS